MPDEEPPSRNLDEFERRTQAMRRLGGDATSLLWKAIDDLAAQVSIVRHEQANAEQKTEIQNFKLFGFDETGRGGKLGELREQIAVASAELSNQMERQMQEVRSTVKWILRLAAYVATIFSGVAILVLAFFFTSGKA